MHPSQARSQDAASGDEAQLVRRTQQGDRRAFDVLVIRYQARILSLISRYIQDRDEVCDVAQETFVKAYRSLAGFRGDSSFYTWLYRIAVSVSLNHLASRAHRTAAASQELPESESGWHPQALTDHHSPEANLAGEQARARLARALQALPEELRSALLLREYDGFSYEQISGILECPVGTVRSRIFRAREQVQISMQSD